MPVPILPADSANPQPSWNVLRDLAQLLEYHFMVNALLAGSIVAVMAGVAGWLMVLRRAAFAGHTLSLMAFPGAGGALLLGLPTSLGYFASCSAGALAIGGLSGGAGTSWREESAGVAAVQALALSLGFLFVSLYGGVLGNLENLLFGNVLGISDGQVLVLAVTAAVVLASLGALARPLLFASVDATAARARGVPVRTVSSAYLLVLGLAVAATSQVTGPLLVFALLLAPAASAQALSARPSVSLALTVILGLAVVWLGMGIAYYTVYPTSVFVSTIAFTTYVLARLAAAVAHGWRYGRAPAPAASAPPRGVIS